MDGELDDDIKPIPAVDPVTGEPLDEDDEEGDDDMDDSDDDEGTE